MAGTTRSPVSTVEASRFDVEDLGHALGAMREMNGLTQTELAKRCGLDRSTICRMERGERCHLGTVSGVVEVLGFKMSEFFRLIEEANEGETLKALMREHGFDPDHPDPKKVAAAKARKAERIRRAEELKSKG